MNEFFVFRATVNDRLVMDLQLYWKETIVNE